MSNNNEFNTPKSLINDLLINDYKFRIPLYQRNYSWTHMELKRLLESINDSFVLNSEKPFFLGNIYLNKDYSLEANSIQYLKVIDGQQRITTFMLIFKAIHNKLCQLIEKYDSNDELKETIKWIEKIFKYKASELKLVSYNSEYSNFEKIMNSEDVSKGKEHSLLVKAFDFITKYFNEHKIFREENLNKIFEFCKFLKIQVKLAQVWFGYSGSKYNVSDKNEIKYSELQIFESINTTGKKLSIFDQLKNYFYILSEVLNLDSSEEKKINSSFKGILNYVNGDSKKLNYFFESYLCFLTGETVIKAKDDNFEIYNGYKKYFQKIEAMISNKSYFFEELNKLIKAIDFYFHLKGKPNKVKGMNSKNTNKKTDIVLNLMSETLYGNLFPFILNFVNHYKLLDSDKIDDFERNVYFQKTLKVIEEYRVKFLLARKDMKDNKTYSTLWRDLNKENNNEINIEDFANKLRLFLINDVRGTAIPADNEIRRQLKTNDIYKKNATLTWFLLWRLETIYEKNNNLNIGISTSFETMNKWQIEHIMPQSFNSEWKDDLEYWIKKYQKDETKNDDNLEIEIDNDYYDSNVLKLGNLTLTGYNQNMSNYTFSEKKKILKDRSTKFELNKYIIEKDKWDKNEIDKRGNDLITILIDYYNNNFDSKTLVNKITSEKEEIFEKVWAKFNEENNTGVKALPNNWNDITRNKLTTRLTLVRKTHNKRINITQKIQLLFDDEEIFNDFKNWFDRNDYFKKIGIENYKLARVDSKNGKKYNLKIESKTFSFNENEENEHFDEIVNWYSNHYRKFKKIVKDFSNNNKF